MAPSEPSVARRDPELHGVEPGEFRRSMRCLAGGVTIVTTADTERRLGLTVTGICSLSADPPALIVCINRQAEAHDLIASTRRLCVNLLGKHHRSLAESFAGRHGAKGEGRFQRGEWGRLATGSPWLKDSISAFDCAIVDSWTFATHSVFVCHVIATGDVIDEEPLVYFDGAFAGLGLHFVDRAMQEAEWV
jgi:flavin reductase (DIM6/NTAB) family NADH-FMN oxidoreductase RutF